MPPIINHNIRTFLKHSFKLITKERSLAAGWPGQEIIKRLVHSASGLFIWAATACRFIREGKRFAAKRLNIILENNSININITEKHFNKIYSIILRNYISPGYLNKEVEELILILKSLLKNIIILLSLLSIQSLSKLLSTT